MAIPRIIVGRGIRLGEGVVLDSNPDFAYGEESYTTPGTYSWIAPANVTSVCVVCIGGGGRGETGVNNNAPLDGYRYGGGGGGLGWKNNIPVTPGQSYVVTVGVGGGRDPDGGGYNPINGGDSYFINTNTVAGLGGKLGGVGGSYVGDGGGNGGTGSAAPWNSSYTRHVGGGAGGGAGGYTGDGGNSGFIDFNSTVAYPTSGQGGGAAGGWSDLHFENYRDDTFGAGPGGSGVGILGQGSSGNYWNGVDYTGGIIQNWGYVPDHPGYGGSGGNLGGIGVFLRPPNPNAYYMKGGDGGNYGGGGGAIGPWWTSPVVDLPGFGGNGAVRIIWGPSRSFPDNAQP